MASGPGLANSEHQSCFEGFLQQFADFAAIPVGWEVCNPLSGRVPGTGVGVVRLKQKISNECVITPSIKVQVLGVVLDTEMTMADHINSVCGSICHQIRNIGLIHRFLCQDTCWQVGHTPLPPCALTSATHCLLGCRGPQLANSSGAKTWQHALSPAHASWNT